MNIRRKMTGSTVRSNGNSTATAPDTTPPDASVTAAFDIWAGSVGSHKVGGRERFSMGAHTENPISDQPLEVGEIWDFLTDKATSPADGAHQLADLS